MDKRTRLIIGGFVVAAGYAAYSSIIGPMVVQPLFSIKQEIAELEIERDELLEKRNETDKMIEDFASFCNRNGSFNILRIEHELRQRLDTLLNEHQLDNTDVSPNEPRTSRKTKLENMKVTVKGVGTFENAMKFLKDVYELPYMVRVGNTKITPLRNRKQERGKKKQEYVNLTVPLEIMKLPRQMVAEHVDKDTLTPAEEFVRHENRDYASVWNKTPFTQYIVYPPLELTVKQDKITIQEGRNVNLEATAKGGDGDYEFEWSGSGVKRPKRKTTGIDTKSPGERTYSVTVSDGQGEVARATVNVTVEKKPERKVAQNRPKRGDDKPKPKPKPKEPTFPQRDSNGSRMKVMMALTSRTGDQRKSEVMVLDERSKETVYYGVGDEFDGGQLVYIHTSGVLARHKMSKNNDMGYFAYPLGDKVANGVEAKGLEDLPRLQWAADWFTEQDALNPPPPPETGDEDAAAESAETDKEARSNNDANKEQPKAATAAARESDQAVDPAKADGNAGKQAPPNRPGTRNRSNPGATNARNAATNRSNRNPAANVGNQPPKGAAPKASATDATNKAGKPATTSNRRTSRPNNAARPPAEETNRTSPARGAPARPEVAGNKNSPKSGAPKNDRETTKSTEKKTAKNKNAENQNAENKGETPASTEQAKPAQTRSRTPANRASGSNSRNTAKENSNGARRPRSRRQMKPRTRPGYGERKRMRPGSRGGKRGTSGSPDPNEN